MLACLRPMAFIFPVPYNAPNGTHLRVSHVRIKKMFRRVVNTNVTVHTTLHMA